jgi:hypothetical protein
MAPACPVFARNPFLTVTTEETRMFRTHQPARQRRPAVRKCRSYALAALCLCAVASLYAGVPAGGSYSLRKQVIAGGGAASSGGSYSLAGTVGQSVTGPTGSGASQLQQGFHAGVAGPDELFNDGFE